MLTNTTNPNRKDVWGYTFDWTPSHLTASDLHPLTLSYDKLTDDCLDEFDRLGLTSSFRAKTSSSNSNPQNGSQCPLHQTDFYTLLSTNSSSPSPSPVLSRLWDQITTIPPWVSYPQLARGQTVFYRYAGPAITSLTFHSLLGGMASHRVVETLARTGGFGVNVARRRLLETFQHILDVTEGVESMKPEGRGWKSTVRVRFLHASVRRRIMVLSSSTQQDGEKGGEGGVNGNGNEGPEKKKGRGYYDTEKYGIPINDLDAIGTIASFSSALIWMGLPRQGIFLTAQEIEDYLALWRYVAYLIGVPDTISLPDGRTITPFGSAAEAKVVIESIVLSELNDPSETSSVLANNIIAALANQPPLRSSESFLRAQAYWLNGSRLCQTLKIPKPPVWHTVLVISQCLFFMVFCYLRQVHYLVFERWWPARKDEKEEVTGLERYQRVRRLMRHVVVELAGGKEASFGFEWVPERGKYTTSDRGDEGEGGKEKLRKKKGGWGNWISSRYGGSEFRSLKAFLVASTVMGCLVWVGVRGLVAGRLPLSLR
ncbi:hypothetical protein B0T20DRAFT_248268 [Sordaria brevicollis]|uniref:ER-bound oxygenase mpaB/mpaB'/Rubber oxygenase catalytic domain-containing protein n=1 Tax=Sordaria brevicollis TaxID=83679 RepID=A0AAE0UAK3_SORBR|nr:hypothetical protein B0T20DRAFT_248268 [Sordaria brevicollis]